MTEKQLIAELQKFRQIKPRKDWVVFTKRQILGEEKTAPSFSFISFLKEIQRGERFIFQHKPAFAVILTLAVFVGLFGFAQNSLPGDTLFPIKRITEKSQAVFVSEREQPKHNLELANKRLDDLTMIAQANSVKNLASAINEFQTSISRAAESLTRADIEKDHQMVKEIVLEVKKLEEKTEKIKSLGVEVGESKEWDNALSQLVEREIKYFEGRTLTEKQEEILTGIKEDCEAGNYSDALEKILMINQ